MNFDRYENTIPYPTKDKFTTRHFYKKGKVVATLRPGEKVDKELNGCIIEKDVDEAAYKKAMKGYREHEGSLITLFKEDLFKNLGIEDNQKRDLLFSHAWDRGHSSGLTEVYNVACDLVELIL